MLADTNEEQQPFDTAVRLGAYLDGIHGSAGGCPVRIDERLHPVRRPERGVPPNQPPPYARRRLLEEAVGCSRSQRSFFCVPPRLVGGAFLGAGEPCGCCSGARSIIPGYLILVWSCCCR